MMDASKNERIVDGPPYQAPESQELDNVGVVNRQYFISLNGTIRVLLIVFSFIGWVSVAAASPCTATCSAYLFFFITYFFKSCFILLFFGLGYNKLKKFDFINKDLTLAFHNAIYLIIFFSFGIASAQNETYLRNYYFVYTRGAMGMGSFAAFVCMILCGVDTFILLRSQFARKNENSTSVPRNSTAQNEQIIDNPNTNEEV